MEKIRNFWTLATGAVVGSTNSGSLTLDHVVVDAPTLANKRRKNRRLDSGKQK